MRPLKEYEILHCKIDKEVSKKLTDVCNKTRLSKTAAVERAIEMYSEYFKTTGKI